MGMKGQKIREGEPNFEAALYSTGLMKSVELLSDRYVWEDLDAIKRSVGYVAATAGKEAAGGVLNIVGGLEGKEASELAMEFKRLALNSDGSAERIGGALKLVEGNDPRDAMEILRAFNDAEFKKRMLRRAVRKGG